MSPASENPNNLEHSGTGTGGQCGFLLLGTEESDERPLLAEGSSSQAQAVPLEPSCFSFTR